MRDALLVQLVPPGIGGVRDYLECLRREWGTAGLASHVLALSERDARERSLVDRLEGLHERRAQLCSLLVHFSGYGYDPRGLCLWLARELENARERLAERLRVVTMFHELSASGPPWSSAFWLAGVQAAIVARIVRVSDRLLTNSRHHASQLQTRFGAQTEIGIWPVFSTVGEPEAITPAAERRARLAVFGSEPTRRRALTKLPRHVDALKSLGIQEVVEFGAGQTAGLAVAGLSHCFAGRLDEPSATELLVNSAFGLLDYPSVHLGKSTVFAAYAVHGCVALNAAAPGADADGLVRGHHLLYLDAIAGSQRLSPADRQSIADAGRGWYATHTLSAQARSIAAVCTAGLHKKEVHV